MTHRHGRAPCGPALQVVGAGLLTGPPGPGSAMPGKSPTGLTPPEPGTYPVRECIAGMEGASALHVRQGGNSFASLRSGGET